MVSVTVAMVGVQIETVMTLIVGTVIVAVTGGRVGGMIVTGGRVGGVTVTVTVDLVQLSVGNLGTEGKKQVKLKRRWAAQDCLGGMRAWGKGGLEMYVRNCGCCIGGDDARSSHE